MAYVEGAIFRHLPEVTEEKP